MATIYHTPVMVQEVSQGLSILPKGDYVDATFGGGGHARAILSKLDGGRLFAFDQDPDAGKQACQLDHPQFTFIQAPFTCISQFLHFYGVQKVHGLVVDLGSSSHQLNEAERGFSFRLDGPLDMRMNPNMGQSAAEIINNYTLKQLTHMFRCYGELYQAARLSEAIVQARAVHGPILTTYGLKEILDPFVPIHKANQYWAKLFQALRIEVNGELKALTKLLEHSTNLVAPGGRLVVLSYHSLEDRLVKHFFNTGNVEGLFNKDGYGNLVRPFAPLHKKPYLPTLEEVQANSRARSARLRVAMRLDINPSL